MTFTPRPLPLGSALICIAPDELREPWPGPTFTLSPARAERWLNADLGAFGRRARAEGCRVRIPSGPNRALARQLRTLLQPTTATDMATVARDLGLVALAQAYQAQTVAADANLTTLVEFFRQHNVPLSERKGAQLVAALEAL